MTTIKLEEMQAPVNVLHMIARISSGSSCSDENAEAIIVFITSTTGTSKDENTLTQSHHP